MLNVGAAAKIINGEIGAWLQGAGVFQRAKRVRDPLEANALFLDNGETQLLFVSCDVVAVPTDVVVAARRRIAAKVPIPERNIMIAGTHTHSGPSVLRTSYKKPLDTAYLEFLAEALVELAEATFASARPGKIGWRRGEAQLGYNRRCCWADGSHSMHWTRGREDFTGLEGPDDPEHTVIAAINAEGKLIAILQNNTSHPTCFYGCDFYSADFPGTSRRFLREIYGEIPVLFFNGAFGDISNENQLAPKSAVQDREQKMISLAHRLTGETLRLLPEMTFNDSPDIRHAFADLPVEVRLPEREKLAWAHGVIEKIEAGENLPAMEQILAWGTVDLENTFGSCPTDEIPIHAIYLDGLAIATQPCELYCQFGLNIKRRSPFAATTVFGITDGYCGYCPTIEGIMGGGYSGLPISWTRLTETGGYQIVDKASQLLHELHR